MYLSTWSLVDSVIWEVMEPLYDGALLEEVIRLGTGFKGLWFLVTSRLLFLCFLCVERYAVSQLLTPVTCCRAFPAITDLPSGTGSQSELSYLSLFDHGVYHSNKK